MSFIIKKRDIGVMHSYKIIQREKLIIQCLVGAVHLQQYLDFCERVMKDPSFDCEYSMVFDFRAASIKLSLDDLREAAQAYLQSDCFKGRKALLVNGSVDTAKIMIFRDHVGNDQRFCVYSTVKGASTFLQNDLTPYLDEDDPIREDLYMDDQFVMEA